MALVNRTLEKVVLNLAKQYQVVTITAPRQNGKTTLCREVLQLFLILFLFSIRKSTSHPESDPQAEKQESHGPDDNGNCFSEYRGHEKGHKNQENRYFYVFVFGADLGKELFIFIHVFENLRIRLF